MRKLTMLPSLAAIVLVCVSLLATGCSPVTRPTAESGAETVTDAVTETTAEATAAQESAASSACTPGAGSIAVLLPDTSSSPRWEMDDRHYFDAMLAQAGVSYTISNAQGDPVLQRAQAQQALAEGATVLVLVNLDSESGAAIIADARAAGAQVIDYDRLTISGPGADVFVSFDNLAVGSLMAQTLEPLINGLATPMPQVVQLNGAAADSNASLVRAGYSSIATPFYDAGRWHLVADQEVPGWDADQARDIFSQILAEAGDEGVDAVFAANDTLAGAVVQVLKTQGHAPILLSGQDATVEALQNILAGWQTMTVYKPIQQEAATAAVVALTLLNCEGVETLNTILLNNGERDIPSILLDPVAVTKDNIAATVIADGFRTWDEICIGEYEQFCPAER